MEMQNKGSASAIEGLPNIKLDEATKQDLQEKPVMRVLFYICLPIFSIFSYLLDIGTDIWVAYEYYIGGHTTWFRLTAVLIVAPLLAVNLASIILHYRRGEIQPGKRRRWLILVCHFFQVGLILRYFEILNYGCKSRFKKEQKSDDQLLEQELLDRKRVREELDKLDREEEGMVQEYQQIQQEPKNIREQREREYKEKKGELDKKRECLKLDYLYRKQERIDLEYKDRIQYLGRKTRLLELEYRDEEQEHPMRKLMCCVPKCLNRERENLAQEHENRLQDIHQEELRLQQEYQRRKHELDMQRQNPAALDLKQDNLEYQDWGRERMELEYLDRKRTYLEQDDRSLNLAYLRLMESFMEAAPQFTLQLYVLQVAPKQEGRWYMVAAQVASCVTSLISLSWSLVSFYRSERKSGYRHVVTIRGTILLFLWRIFTVAPRILAFAVFAAKFKYWLFVVIAGHWLLMLLLSPVLTPFPCCSSARQEFLRLVLSAIYVFAYVPVVSKRINCRYPLYYFIVFLENLGMVLAWFILSLGADLWYRVPVICMVTGGFLFGMLMQAVYLCYRDKGARKHSRTHWLK